MKYSTFKPVIKEEESKKPECEVRPRGVQLRDDGPVPKTDNFVRRVPRRPVNKKNPVPRYSPIASSPPRHLPKCRRRSRRFSLDGEYNNAFFDPPSYSELPDFGPVDPNPVISLHDFELKQILGTGAQGRVYAATSAFSIPGKLFAVKATNKRFTSAAADTMTALLEQIVLKQVRGHKFILELEASFHDTEFFYLVTPYYTGGDLESLIKYTGRLPIEALSFYTAEITCGLNYLHKNNIIHQDLKPANILMKGSGHIVISDFGLVKSFDYRPVGGNVSWRKAKLPPNTDRPLADTGGGTPFYMAPEMLFRNLYSFEVDWWSLGVSVLEMLLGSVSNYSHTLISYSYSS
ncbi:hypothetical protein AMATHDRAFT_148696 [Amanita thiersii Skay4041]|uniref:Protein kinase domain-containing protein n=1 Tax=Amanita thiersii Skay4041 TaxID=703135 RepID=A0A2A9NEA0_9AGAR|nr:hypothetical protein AMATHDRAFT_148696 [Amanita thiersii Skay4041]